MEKGVLQSHRPVDLAWIDPFSSSIALHCERENSPQKIKETILEKLLPKNGNHAKRCIGIFDELQTEDYVRVETLAHEAFHATPECEEALMICYSHIPSVNDGTDQGVMRFQMEWAVRGLHLMRGIQHKWLEARCTTDKNHFYTMFMVDPAVPFPYRTKS